MVFVRFGVCVVFFEICGILWSGGLVGLVLWVGCYAFVLHTFCGVLVVVGLAVALGYWLVYVGLLLVDVVAVGLLRVLRVFAWSIAFP